MITDELIIECAKSKGFYLPKGSFKHFGITYYVDEKDIKVVRARTAPMAGDKDLGEWWVSYPGSMLQYVVKDEDMKAFMRDYKIKKVLK